MAKKRTPKSTDDDLFRVVGVFLGIGAIMGATYYMATRR